MAFTAWDTPDRAPPSTPNYPCIPLMGVNDCGDSTFVDQTSSASPTVADCLAMIEPHRNTNEEWEVENAIAGNQHQLLGYGTCNFGVQGDGQNGNIDYFIGSQDIVDLVTSSIQMFGGSGQVGAKGEMPCNGDTDTPQNVIWGIY